MTAASVAHSDLADSQEAGRALGSQILAGFEGEQPDVVIVFASSTHDYQCLLRGIQETVNPPVMVGCSSAGEFISGAQSVGSASAVALVAPDMHFKASLGRNLRASFDAAAASLAEEFEGLQRNDFRYRSALVLTDALAGQTDELIEQLARRTAGSYRFFGGGAGDDGKFRETHIFYGTEAVPDAAVCLEILSNKPLGIGVRHGWQPASPPMRVTEADGRRLVSLNAIRAGEVLNEHAQSTGQIFDPAEPLPFFLHNVIGVDTGGGHKLRVPLGLEEDGSLFCAGDIPAGATAQIMGTSARSAVEAAASATEDAVGQLNGLTPSLALFFDCVATRLRIGSDFGYELRSVQEALGPAKFAGCNTYGQVARADGQFSGFHNCTAVVCVIPE